MSRLVRRKLLDLYCGAGGASAGYAAVGYAVTGVDIAPQPNYPFPFHQADALTFPLDGFDFVHASPPCQSYSAMSACRPGLAGTYAALIGATRDRLQRSGLPWVIENVEGSPLATGPTIDGRYGVTLCGTMFGLDLYRHRIFESNVPLIEPEHPAHVVPASRAGHWVPGTVMSVSGHVAPIAVARAAMGIDWTTRDELAEAIPPAYTEWVGQQMAGTV